MLDRIGCLEVLYFESAVLEFATLSHAAVWGLSILGYFLRFSLSPKHVGIFSAILDQLLGALPSSIKYVRVP
jgi:hypothetical protein